MSKKPVHNLDISAATRDELTENIPEGIKPIIHSDQGWHYQLNYYTDKLSEKNLYKACLVRETVLIMRQLKASFIFLKQNVLWISTV